MLNEISQTEGDKYHMVSFIYAGGMESTVTENRTVVTRDWGRRKWKDVAQSVQTQL